MSNFWSGKQVIVTGACGMVGSRLCEFLRDEGAKVFGFDDMSRGDHYVAGCQYHVGDARDLGEWARFFAYRQLRPFAIFNLAAAVGGVYFNIKNHTSQFYENVQLQTVPTIIAAQRNVPIFVQVSSVCVYADDFNDPAIEEYGDAGRPERANEGYAWAKRMGEEVCYWSFEGTDTKFCIVRPTNMYGIRDYFDERAHVIPALIKKFLTQDEVVVYGGSQTREFLYADDGARGMMAVAEHGSLGEIYNLGTSGETQITIGQLAEMIYALTESDANVTIDHNAKTGDIGRSTDSSKARVLGWEHQIGLEEGLRRVINWYQSRNAS
jgi:GDP-L-fucose synthase